MQRSRPRRSLSQSTSSLGGESKWKKSYYKYDRGINNRKIGQYWKKFRQFQKEVQRYVMEDRFSAIRIAIGTAQKNDVVVIAGKGARDYLEWGDIDDNIVKGWFDDRVEARNALAKLPYLQQIQYLNRKQIPWTQD
eukprot:TRINITY_DN92262_c0_g3_i5.p4 TRINITY_DN92262_c0_g3~~TRINITY_DN92262_c0_g3_i5.p4  ORF type:complete len:136 (-),score=16.99 TRINITY_DN92262_c0_g3_i5:714-1121(-)